MSPRTMSTIKNYRLQLKRDCLGLDIIQKYNKQSQIGHGGLIFVQIFAKCHSAFFCSKNIQNCTNVETKLKIHEKVFRATKLGEATGATPELENHLLETI